MYVTLLRESAAMWKQYRIDCWLDKKVIEKPVAPIVETIEAEPELDIEVLRAEYLEKFWKKISNMAKAETIKPKLEQQ